MASVPTHEPADEAKGGYRRFAICADCRYLLSASISRDI